MGMAVSFNIGRQYYYIYDFSRLFLPSTKIYMPRYLVKRILFRRVIQRIEVYIKNNACLFAKYVNIIMQIASIWPISIQYQNAFTK